MRLKDAQHDERYDGDRDYSNRDQLGPATLARVVTVLVIVSVIVVVQDAVSAFVVDDCRRERCHVMSPLVSELRERLLEFSYRRLVVPAFDGRHDARLEVVFEDYLTCRL